MTSAEYIAFAKERFPKEPLGDMERVYLRIDHPGHVGDRLAKSLYVELAHNWQPKPRRQPDWEMAALLLEGCITDALASGGAYEAALVNAGVPVVTRNHEGGPVWAPQLV